jgi:hypothetical protein
MKENYIDEKHFTYLEQLGFSEKEIESIRKDNDAQYAKYQPSVVMKYCWDGVINPNMHENWLNDVHRMLKGENFEPPKHQLSFYDESEWDELEQAVSTLLDSKINQKALLKLIRACQKTTLGEMFQLLDGGSVGDFSLFEIGHKGGGYFPLRPFPGMEDFFMEYDPVNLKPENKK